MNAIACSSEENAVRISREINARKLRRAPLNLDNRGLWYQVQVPPTASPTPVQGVLGETTIQLTEFDDFLPIPTRISPDPNRTSMPADSLTLWSIAGTGFPVQSGPLVLAIPNKLYFWVEGIGDSSLMIEVQIDGYQHPHTYWASNVDTSTEVLDITDDGPYATDRTWESINQITVRGLPAGATLTVYLMAFAMPMQSDHLQPMVIALDRDVVFDRRWRLNGQMVEEGYALNRWVGFSATDAYVAPQGLVSIAVEPNTYGLLAATAVGLLYADRREPVPDNLYNSAISIEPAYGLRVSLDPTRVGNVRYVGISTDMYDGGTGVIQYRLTMQAPDKSLWVIFPNGDLGRYSNQGGWNAGTPGRIQVGLPSSWAGTFWFTLETVDQYGTVTKDNQPFVLPAFTALASLDVTSLVTSLAGAGYDSRDRLWLWTGSMLVPALFNYDAYVYDPTSNSVYLTDQYDQVLLG